MQKILTSTFAATSLLLAGLYITDTSGEDELDATLAKVNELQVELLKLEESKKSLHAAYKAELDASESELENLRLKINGLLEDRQVVVKKVELDSGKIKSDDEKISRGKKKWGTSPSLMSRLKLDEKDEQKLIRLLADLRRTRYGHMAGLTDEQIAAKKADIDAELQALLGDQYDEYAHYAKREDQYRFVDKLDWSMKNDLALNQEQKDSLAEVMYQNSTTMNSFSGKGMNRFSQYASMSSEELEEIFVNVEEENNKILEESAGIMTPEQLKAVQEQMNQQVQRGRRGVEYMKAMRNGALKDSLK